MSFSSLGNRNVGLIGIIWRLLHRLSLGVKILGYDLVESEPPPNDPWNGRLGEIKNLMIELRLRPKRNTGLESVELRSGKSVFVARIVGSKILDREEKYAYYFPVPIG